MSLFQRWVDSAKALASFVFIVFGIWNFLSPIDEATVLSLINIIAAILGVFLGGPAFLRILRGERQINPYGLDDFQKWVDSVKSLVGFAFVVFAIWNYNFPIDQQTLLTLVDVIAVILGAFLGVPPARRLIANRRLEIVDINPAK